MTELTSGDQLPPYTGNSWRPAAAGLLSAVPLALVSAALAGASVVAGLQGAPGPAAPPPAQHGAALPVGSMLFTTVFAGRVLSPKIPAGIGD